MKNFVKGLGIIAFVVVIGFSMVACNLDNDDDNAVLDGTWIGGAVGDNDHWMWVFSGSNWTLKEEDGSIYLNYQKGTFSLNSSKTKFTGKATHEWRNGSWVTFNGFEAVCDINISGNTLIMTSHGNSPGWPDSWTETYTKQ